MKLLRTYLTLKYLKPIQIRYRLWYMLKRKLVERGWQNKRFSTLKDAPPFPIQMTNHDCYLSQNSLENLLIGTFVFINETKQFEDSIDWNRSDLNVGTRLWKLNLHYQNYLIDAVHDWSENKNKEALAFIEKTISSWISENPLGKKDYAKDNWNSYSISLRVINWVKVYSELHEEFDEPFKIKWRSSLWNQVQFLYENIEYDIQGNHLLENGFGLLFAAYFFQNKKFYTKAKQILEQQLDIQILNDGAHFELSPMYHSIILVRMLDSYNLVAQNSWIKDEFMLSLKEKTKLMLGWLDVITNSAKLFPLLNDASNNIAPSPQHLFDYAKQLNLEYGVGKLKESGYRVIQQNQWRAIFDVGQIGPNFIPGHAHADSLQIVCSYIDQPFIVDTGTSTYNAGEIRNRERSTAAHNTVDFQGKDSSEVWSSFRVAERAKVQIEVDDVQEVIATHNGYKRYNVIHKRSVRVKDLGIEIKDEISTGISLPNSQTLRAHFHFHPDITMKVEDNRLIWKNGFIAFENQEEITLKNYEYAPEFNKRIQAQKAIISFTKELVTNIQAYN